MIKLCPKCVLAVGVGLLASVGLALCVKNAHLWSVFALVAAVGACMLLGETLPAEDSESKQRTSHSH
ncbi:hypothetical protein KFE80_11300 [bacterium SCSIO 12696]|nr:hypothetical protein KFE80_11300 [bacterium SCSIO 12696]